MTRHVVSPLRRVFVMAGVLAFAACCHHDRVTQRQIHPTSGSGGPYVVAVLADRFSKAEEQDFNTAAENYFLRGLLADSDYYAAKADQFRIVTFFKAWDPSSSTASLYGIQSATGTTNCSISGTPGVTFAEIDRIVGEIDPWRTVIIGNNGSAFGCTASDWVYVTSGGVGQDVIHHEFGHMVGLLWDEYVLPANQQAPHPSPPNRQNCSPNQNAFQAHSLPGVPGCDFYGQNVFRPSSSCRMLDLRHGSFCRTCRTGMDDAFAAGPSYTPAAYAGLLTPAAPRRILLASFGAQPASRPTVPDEAPVLRLLVTFDVNARTATVRRGTSATGRYVPQYGRTGSYVYEVSENGKPLAVGVLAAQLFQVRDYRGGPQPHGVSEATAADVVVRVPGESVDSVRRPGRSLQLTFYRLAPSVTETQISPDVLAKLKTSNAAEEWASVPPEVLRKALSDSR